MRLRVVACLVAFLVAAFAAGCTSPPCPPGVQAVAAGQGSVLVTWGAVPNATAYIVFRGEDGGPLTPFAGQNATAEPSFFDTNVTLGHSYAYAVLTDGQGSPPDDCPPATIVLPDASVPFFSGNGLVLASAGALVGVLLVGLRRR